MAKGRKWLEKLANSFPLFQGCGKSEKQARNVSRAPLDKEFKLFCQQFQKLISYIHMYICTTKQFNLFIFISVKLNCTSALNILRVVVPTTIKKNKKKRKWSEEKCERQTKAANAKAKQPLTRGWKGKLGGGPMYVPYVIHMFGGLFVYGGPHSVEEMYTNPTESKKKKKKLTTECVKKRVTKSLEKYCANGTRLQSLQRIFSF